MFDQPIRILIVDDEGNVLKALERVFMDDEYEIVTCGSGEEGLAALEKGATFQVVISDYRMPVMNGVEFLRAVYSRWPQTVRIVLSGYADSGAIVDAINLGHIYKFIPKPWNDDELKVTIANALERYFLQRKNELLLEELAASNENLRSTNENLEQMVEARIHALAGNNQALAACKTILDRMPIGIVGIDQQGTIVQMNNCAASLMGLTCPIAGEVFRAVLPDTLITAVEEVGRLGETDLPVQMEHQTVRVLGKACHAGAERSLIMALIPPPSH